VLKTSNCRMERVVFVLEVPSMTELVILSEGA